MAPSPNATTADESAASGEFRVKKTRFQVTYRLDAATAEGSAIGIDVPFGTRLVPSVESGQRVKPGQVLGRIELVGGLSDAEGTVEQSRDLLRARSVGPVLAEVGGVARISGSAVWVESSGIDVVVGLKPLQELRYRGMAFSGSASVETVLGQQAVPCMAVWLSRSKSDPDPEANSGAELASVHCRLGENVETAPGLSAVLVLASPAQNDVVTVPIIYIGLDAGGENYVARVRQGDGSYSERPVIVGATDGVRRVVLSGLEPGDVLAPVVEP
jgi:multidrug efflux pump subunit AcrA (membrane-fusion protein)